MTIGSLAAISAVAEVSAASLPVSNVYAWGSDAAGQLGPNGTYGGESVVPLEVILPSGITPAAISGNLAIGSDGNAYDWGANSSGQLGDGTTTASETPVRVSLPSGIHATAISGSDLDNADLVIGSDGNVYAWGDNSVGELGDGTTGGYSDVPVKVSLPSGITATAISNGGNANFAIGSNGNIYAWGENYGPSPGELGDGNTNNAYVDVPVKVRLPAGITATAVSTGDWATMAIGSDGNIYAWGDNGYGEFGNGKNSGYSAFPVKVSLPVGVTPTAIAESGFTSLAIGSDGNAYAWGLNQSGTVGDGNYDTFVDTPVKVLLPSGITATAISASDQTAMAIGSDGNIYAWGDNGYGQLGDDSNTITQDDIPAKASLPDGATANAISEEGAASFAILTGTGPVVASTTTCTPPYPNEPYTSTTYGQPVTFTATVSGPPGLPTPTGTVDFIDESGTLDVATLNGAGIATFTTSSLPVPGPAINAVYLGNSYYPTSQAFCDESITYPRGTTSTTTTLTSSLNPSTYGQSVTFSATVAPTTGTGTPSGIVTFFLKNGKVPLGTANVDSGGTATLAVSSLGACGAIPIIAVYSGDDTFAASQTSSPLDQAVNQAATTTVLVGSPNPSTSGQPVTFTATVTSGGGTPTGTVSFVLKNGHVVVGTEALNANGTATFAYSALAVGGSIPIVAIYSGDTNFSTSTSTVDFQVVT